MGCTSATMASGTTCQTTCDAGYLVAGTSSCSDGTFTQAACDASTVASSSPDTAKTGVATTITLVTTNVASDANTMWKIIANGGTCGGTDASDKVGAWAAGTATYVSATSSTFVVTVPSGTAATGTADYVLCVATKTGGTYAAPTGGAEAFDVTAGTAVCNATAATYTNGAAGACTSETMASGTTCQSTCDATHTTAGTSSCVDGTLTVAACNANVCTRPSTAGYVYTSENAANCLVSTGTAATCSASLTCATGYTGTPVATLCTSAGAYSVTGCTEVTTTTTTAPASTTTTAAPASTATTASPAAKAAVDAGVQVTPNKMGILIAFLALFFIH